MQGWRLFIDGVAVRADFDPDDAGVQVDVVYRGRSTSGCVVAGHIKHSSKVCRSDYGRSRLLSTAA